jgi:SAM-dependent methyltransferase
MPPDFTVTALLSAFNEADVIAEVIEHLVAQRVDVYVIDDGSTDDTASIAERYLGRGVIGLERRPVVDGAGAFSWSDILRRKEALAAEIESTWFIHHDADELRESPTRELDLRAAIQGVDHLGYNAITFTLLNFPPIDDEFGPGRTLREHFRFYEPGPTFDEVQVKCWRKGAAAVDLASSGGHQASFAGRRICPIPFITRHYPIRSQAHGERKVLRERQRRFSTVERARGWHVQYNTIAEGHSFHRDPASLIVFDLDGVRDRLTFALPGEEVRVRDEQLATTRRLLQAAADERQNLEVRLAERQTAVDHARKELQTVLQSQSWRMTRPLRRLNTLLTGAPTAAADAGAGRAGRFGSAAARAGTVAPVRWGDLARVAPFSRRWGFDRGLPIDRHYIRQFLEQNAADVHGRVLEVKDANYSKMFGADRIATIDVIDVDPQNTEATIVANLANASAVDGNRFDCFILTQTVHIIFDAAAAIREAARLLDDGGVLLCTIPAVSRVSDEDGGLDGGDYWRMTRAAVVRLFHGAFLQQDVHVATYGNVRTCAAFLYGLAAEELEAHDLSVHDPRFPLIHCIRAVKRR